MGCLRLDILEQDYKRSEHKMFAIKSSLTKNKTKINVRTAYLYGMNGQEKDNEIFEGAYTAEYWEYDSRIGRRWNTDPIEYPWQSSYTCFNDNPIYYSDPNGLEGEGWVPKEGGGYKYDADPSKGTETADWTGGDINGWNYEVHGNKDGSLEVTHHDVIVRPEITDEERFKYSRNTSRIMNDFSKGLLITAVAIPAAVVAVESGFAMWALKAAGVGALEELAGIPTPGGMLEKQAAKKVGKELIEKAIQKADPFDLIPTHGITKSKSQYNKLKLAIKNDGEVIESIKYVEHHGKKYVVDGHHRLKAAIELGFSEVPVEKVNLPYAGYKTVDDLQYSDY
jgi:ParB-like nuclease domain